MLTPPHFRGKEKDGVKVQNKKKKSDIDKTIKKEQRHTGAAPLLFL